MGKSSNLMKTFIYILPDKNAGVASVVKNLLRYRSRGYRTKVLLLHNILDDEKNRIKEDFNADKIVRIIYNGKWSSKYTIFNNIITELDKHSIVISNDGGLELDALSYLKFPIPVIYILHGNFQHYFKVIEKHKSHIGTVITVSDFLKNKLHNLNSNLNIASIRFPVPEAESVDRISEDNILRLVFVGTLISDKGIFLLPPILKLLTFKNISFSLNIIGSGEDEEKLKDDLSSFETVSFKGKLPNKDVLQLHASHDIILLPSKTEGLPVVIVEAMKYGVVPITTNLESGIPELIDHEINGFTVPIGEMEHYVNYIERLDLNRVLLNKMSKLCIDKAERYFSPHSQTVKYEDAILNTMVNGNKGKKSLLDFLPMTIVHKLKLYLKK